MVNKTAKKYIAKVTLANCVFITEELFGERLHRITITGPFARKERIALYKETLKLTLSNQYFCILDNSGRHENILNHSDIILFDKMLIDAGISRFYGATITQDLEYTKLVELARVNAEISKLQGNLIATNSHEEAYAFILANIKSIQYE